MSSLFSLPKTAAFNSSGDPLMGAQLLFYATASSTPQAVYADADLNTSLGTTVTADAYGVFPAIFLQDLIYRVTLVDAGGVTQWTVDGVGPEALTAADIGAALYPQTAAELAVNVTPTDYQYPPGDSRRYSVALTDLELAEVAYTGAYYETAERYSVAVGGKVRSRLYGSSTITELELRSADAANTGDVYIRFKEADGTTKGFLGYTGNLDDSFTMTSQEDMRLKFRTGKTGDATTFLNRAFIHGDNSSSWVAVSSPDGITTGGCFIRFTLDDYSVTKGYVGYTSTLNDDLEVQNTVTGGDISLSTSGGAVQVLTGTPFRAEDDVSFTTLANHVDDAAAATAGIAVGQLYRNGSIVMVRVA